MIEARKDGFIGTITLTNPEKHNALDAVAMARVIEVLADWTDSDLRVVILNARGKSFCSGVSFAEVKATDWSDNPLEKMCSSIENFRTPVIAALQGGVYGGGVDLALACDFRIGVEDMKMFVPPAKLGIHYHPSGIARAIDRLGAQMARRVFLRAEKFEGVQLPEIGFLDLQVGPDALEEQAQKMAEEIAELAPLAVQGMKQTIVETSSNRLDVDAALKRVADCFASTDHAEGLRAMAEKRQPVFKGC